MEVRMHTGFVAFDQLHHLGEIATRGSSGVWIVHLAARAGIRLEKHDYQARHSRGGHDAWYNKRRGTVQAVQRTESAAPV